ncbi:MAG: DUF1963 domain-containing protein, partial [Tepidisphaeraceae bacterium]
MIRLDPCKKQGAQQRSWFGGTPCLPPDIQWPVWDPTVPVTQWIEKAERRLAAYEPRQPRPGSVIGPHDPRPSMRKWIDRMRSHLQRVPRFLNLLAQINLADARDAVDFVDLPRRGTLWFFQDVDLYFPTHPESWRVIYRETDADNLRELAVPPGFTL